jgi:hypothetical protein
VDYVALLKFNSSSSAAERDAALVRRASWTYPAGMNVIAEYWPMSSQVQVVTIFATDSPALIMELELEWSDVFEVDVSPAVSAEQGLQFGAEMLGRLTRFQS